MEAAQNGCFVREHPLKMDDLGVPPFMGTSTCCKDCGDHPMVSDRRSWSEWLPISKATWWRPLGRSWRTPAAKISEILLEPCFVFSRQFELVISKLLEVECGYLYLNYWSYFRSSLNGYQFLQVDFHTIVTICELRTPTGPSTTLTSASLSETIMEDAWKPKWRFPEIGVPIKIIDFFWDIPLTIQLLGTPMTMEASKYYRSPAVFETGLQRWEHDIPDASLIFPAV